MKNTLYKKHNYLNKDIKFIKNSIIKEYDMKNAGLNILYNKEFINTKEYNKLLKMDKLKRNVIIGKFLRDNPDINKELMEGFIEARKLFFEKNDIDDSEILSIKKDAIFLINNTPAITKLNDNYVFRKKNEYNCYLNIRNKEFYYSEIDKELNIKGFSKEIIESQKDYIFKFIEECMNLVTLERKDDLFIKLLEFKNDFIEKELDINYYRDIDRNTFLFKYKNQFLEVEDLGNINFKNSEYASITNNLTFLIELISNILS